MLRFHKGPKKGQPRTDAEGDRYWREKAMLHRGEWGHLGFDAWINGSVSHVSAGRFICTLFHGPCPEGCECCHNSGVASDNRASNLRWDTHPNNLADKNLHGTAIAGERHPFSKLTDKKVFAMRREACENGWTLAEVADIYDIHYVTARAALIGESWKHVGGPLMIHDPNRPSHATPADYRWTTDRNVNTCSK